MQRVSENKGWGSSCRTCCCLTATFELVPGRAHARPPAQPPAQRGRPAAGRQGGFRQSARSWWHTSRWLQLQGRHAAFWSWSHLTCLASTEARQGMKKSRTRCPIALQPEGDEAKTTRRRAQPRRSSSAAGTPERACRAHLPTSTHPPQCARLRGGRPLGRPHRAQATRCRRAGNQA